MNKIFIASLIAVVGLIFSIAVYVFKIGGEHFIFITDFIAALYSLIAVVFGIMAFRIYKNSLHGKSLILILMGIFLWSSAEILWLLFFTKIYVAVESLRLLGYIPLTIGFFYALIVSDPKFRQEKKHILIVIVAFLIFSAIYLILTPVVLGAQSLLKSITINGYIGADFSLLFGIFLLMKVSFSYKGGYMSKVWFIFAAAFACAFFFDLYFAFYWKTYYQGSYKEILVLLNYILTALGFYYNIYAMNSLRDAVKFVQIKSAEN